MNRCFIDLFAFAEFGFCQRSDESNCADAAVEKVVPRGKGKKWTKISYSEEKVNREKRKLEGAGSKQSAFRVNSEASSDAG